MFTSIFKGVVMTELIGFPFTITKNGSVVTREDGSVDGLSEDIAVLCLTQPGERELVPEFGLPDISFDGILQEELAGKIALFGPEVSVNNIKSSFPREGIQQIEIEYEPLVDDVESEESYDA
jgi:hypothetical protein